MYLQEQLALAIHSTATINFAAHNPFTTHITANDYVAFSVNFIIQLIVGDNYPQVAFRYVLLIFTQKQVQVLSKADCGDRRACPQTLTLPQKLAELTCHQHCGAPHIHKQITLHQYTHSPLLRVFN